MDLDRKLRGEEDESSKKKTTVVISAMTAMKSPMAKGKQPLTNAIHVLAELTDCIRAARQIKFAKMPVRTRAGSSPLREKEPPDLLVTSPSKRTSDDRLRRGSHDAIEAVKQRERRDTTTSSEFSSENEFDNSAFKRRQIKPSRTNPAVNFLVDQADEDDRYDRDRLENVAEVMDEDSAQVSGASSLSSEFAGTADSESLLSVNDEAMGSSSLADLMPAALVVNPPSPRRTRNQAPPNNLQALPPPRPISTIIPGSALGQAIRAQKAKPKNPIEMFAPLDGKGNSAHFSIRIYAPFSDNPSKPFEMLLLRETTKDVPVTVAEAIGYSLWRYSEEKLKPPIPTEKLDVNRWTLRIVDDGEVEYDFPALNRVSNMGDFTSNNNQPVRGRGRARKAFDEFALVEASESQYEENKRLTPKYTHMYDEITKATSQPLSIPVEEPANDSAITEGSPVQTAISKPWAFASRKGSAATLDRPVVPTNHSTPRMGPPKILKIHFTTLEAQQLDSTVEVTTDTYLAEVLDMMCKRWGIDKAYHTFRVSGMKQFAYLDRTVESIGKCTDLDLVRRRFGVEAGGGIIAGSPSSSSPNAPLFLTPATSTPPSKKNKNRHGPGTGSGSAHPLSQNQQFMEEPGALKRYNVLRKQPMSFTPSHPRILLLDKEYLHIVPSEANKTLFDTTNSKSTTVPFSMVIGCKVSRRHAKTFRLIMLKDKERKRYDFEANSSEEATEIVELISKGMAPFKPIQTGVDSGKKPKAP